jgi:hypothetical protein
MEDRPMVDDASLTRAKAELAAERERSRKLVEALQVRIDEDVWDFVFRINAEYEKWQMDPAAAAWQRKPVTHEWMYVGPYEVVGDLAGWEIGEGHTSYKWEDWVIPLSRPIETSEQEESER